LVRPFSSHISLVIHSFAKVGVPATDLQRLDFFDNVCYDIGGLNYSLNDIENGILRANRVPPYHFNRPFGKTDARLGFALEPHERRIHFGILSNLKLSPALNCGASSCPPVKSFSVLSINEELDIVAQAFFEQETNFKFLDLDKTPRLMLSKILQWYMIDFGVDIGELCKTICPFLRGNDREVMDGLIGEGKVAGLKVGWFVYDWGNDAKRGKRYEKQSSCVLM
jgi:hypothetical protein